ncbi:uncharacterized protein MAM_02749 [Metarhizium album ARSEF 1941]|uniref:DUF7820 domain-containing protein n=1 Tax=Metarhizium album (strain ARSEF 1941) TaxID=1081103 RepID=A0A0B2WSK2_METAS|nr:uncharacterized protein MAM_02749 [Metarhizium album ARSEF 1941]KHN99051.1 hypothetical protein MAM_02749 [Metarhizium album ARSEF 1941]
MSERRASVRRSRRVPAENTVGDDEYDLAAHAVSDGFRPVANDSPESPRTNPPPSPLPTRFHLSNVPRSPPPPAFSPVKGLADLNRPSSTSKPPRFHDTLTLRNDGLESAHVVQSSSPSSSFQGGGPYQGSTQPSHPYQLYTQRTYSNATSSTSPSSETLDETRVPAHPYDLYTQNITTPDESTQQRIPIGFNGMGNSYRRQIGPDGEDAGDLIGPLGHMEELPPYSRYPEEPFQHKLTANHTDGAGARTIGLTGSRRIQPIPGAGGIGLATRNPEFSSTEDLAGSPRRTTSSIRSRASLESRHEINGAARNFVEKPSPSKWQRRAKKKFCGVVPYWAICLLLSGIVVMGVVMGTVIGTIVTRQNGSNPKGKGKFDKNERSPSGVVFLPYLPRGLPPLATGCYSLPPMDKSQAPKSCIKDSEQTSAWNCDMPFRWYSMNVSEYDGGTEISHYAMNLRPFDPEASKFMYGTQPPNIPDFQPMRLVNDTKEINRGPAWFLEIKYNKTVTVPEGQLTPPGSSSPQRRWDHPESSYLDVVNSRFSRKGMAVVEGDKPWTCTWPNVSLQIYVYPNQTSTPLKTTTTSDPNQSVVSTLSPTPTSPSGGQPTFQDPYPKLVKVVERRAHYSDDYAPATCTQYRITNDGQDREPVLQNGKPVTFVIQEVGKLAKAGITRRFGDSSHPTDFFALEGRDVELAPCGCVSFSWSV